MKRNKKIYRPFSLGFLVLITTGMIFACRPAADENKNTARVQPDSVSPPVIIKAGKFEVNSLDTLAPPMVVMLSQRPAPVKTPAGFYMTMQNFNTEDGLALSSLICGYKDKVGNLWFGTSGNGVSMYNGKSFTNYSSSHGLIHNFISTITEDSKGNMWFGTYGGVSKYDGIAFENFTTEQGLIDNNVYKILEDSKGNIWLATAGGVSRYNPSEKNSAQISFVNFDTEDGLPAGSVIYIMEDRNGGLWFGGSGGISKYNTAADTKGQKAFEDFSASMGVDGKMVNTITEDKDGIIWVGTDELLSRYDPTKEGSSEKAFIHFTVADGLADNHVLSSMEDRQGNLWFGTKGGVSRYSKADSSFLNFTTAQGLADNQVESITKDNSGSLWFGTYGGGLSKYDGESVVEYSSAQGLPGKAIYAITEDTKGNLWFAPLDGGIVKYQRTGHEDYGGTFTIFTTEQGFSETTAYTSVEDSNGNLWLGTLSGLFKYDGASFTAYTTEQGLPDNYINALSTDRKGNLWIGTYDGGVSKFDGKSFTNFSTEQGLVHKTVWNFFEDKDGIIWIATRGGLSRFDGKKFMNFTKAQGLPDNKLSTVMQDSRGNILTAGWGGGVSIIRKRNVEKLALPDAGQNDEHIFEHFSTAEGLANDVVYNILEDNNSNLIIGTSYGFTILKGGLSTEEGKIAKAGIENYNEKTGYPIKDVSHIYSLYKDSQGLIWAGTGDKLVRFDYGSVHKSTKAPTVFIQHIKINHETISWRSLQRARQNDGDAKQKKSNVPPYLTNELLTFGRTMTDSERDTMIQTLRNVQFDGIQPFYSIPENLVLPYGKNNMSFDFVGVETARPHLVRYRYKLEGNDENWSPVTDKSTATFGNIFEGTYTFMVQAQSPDGVWSQPLTYSFKILPPWYRSWFAYLFYSLLFVGGVYSVYRIQTAHTIRKEREKTQQRELEQVRKIEKAYRELEIEAALERVRSTSMAMHHTSELQGVVNTVAQQLQHINLDINGGVFIMINDEIDSSEDAAIWGSGGAADYVQKAVIPFLDRPIFVRLCDAIRKREEFLVEHYTREEKIEFFEHLFKHPPWNASSQEKKNQLVSLPGDYARSLTISPQTSIFMINNTGKPFSDEDNAILKRFGKVFEQSYIRFLDLQKAEAQAKETKIEVALEKVRNVALSLKKSEDMLDVAQALYEQLLVLGFTDMRNAIIDIHDDKTETFFDYDYSEEMGGTVTRMSYYDDLFIEEQVRETESSHDAFFELVLEGEKLQDLIDMRIRNGEKEDPRLRKTDQLTYNLYSFGDGAIGISNFGMLTDGRKEILKRFRNVFTFAYKRYTDLARAEAQAKEAMRQAALDRVRGEISSMRSAEDLQQIIPVIWRELTVLGIPFFRCGVCILDEKKSTIRLYLSAPDGHLLSILDLPFGANSFTMNLAKHWQKGTVYKEHWDREDFIKWTKSMTERGQIRDEKAYPGAEEPPESLDLHLIPFKQGMLYIGNNEPLTPDEITLSKSLTEAFSVAYARYDDFNQLEQAKEKVEAALIKLQATQEQLLQQEKLASLGQLTAGIAHEIKNPLNFVKNFSEVSVELIEEAKEELLAVKSPLEGGKDGVAVKGDDRSYILSILNDIETNLSKIHEHGHRADSIVKSMLQHSRGGSSTVERTHLNALVKEFVNLSFHGMRAGKNPINVDIKMDLDDNAGEVLLKAQDFSRVIVNLCNNAFDAMREKASVKSETADEYLPKLTVKTHRKDGEVIIEIADNGPGIPEAIRDKIMQPFFTTKKGTEGTGLGLSITNDIVKAHGGSLEISTGQNEGTCFTIKLS